MTSTIAIVGRTNVGKSTLFNRLSSSVKALTLDYAGVTRDILKDTVEWQGQTFELVDTGGISLRKSNDEIAEKVRQHVLDIIKKAEILLFVVDGAVGVTHEDREIVGLLHEMKKRVIVVVNKADRSQTQEYAHEGFALGYRDVVFVSAQHGIGIHELLQKIVDMLPVRTAHDQENPSYRVMLLGRPNVGKSSLMNALLKYERSIVSNQPGTTREPITESIAFYKEHLTLTDTPGIRRKRSIDTELESMMIKSAFQALKDTDVVVLLIDATQGEIVDQDLKLAFYAFAEQYKSLIILVNKSDIVTEEQQAQLEQSFKVYRHLMKKIPIVRISCKTEKNIGRVLPLINEVWQRANTAFSESELTSLFVSALRERPLMRAQQSLTLHKAYQVKKAPLTIVLEVNKPPLFGASQIAFFENLLRKVHDLTGVPVRFLVRKPRGPLAQSEDED